MPDSDQRAVIEFLGSPATYRGAEVERIDTHTAIVFLAGDRALKLKRAVRFDYLDYSAVDKRKTMCEAEVRLNRRTAPSMYRGVLPITREADGSLAIGGAGEVVDWVVAMARFPLDAFFDVRADVGRLDVETMRALGEAIARFHRCAEPRADHGGATGMRWVVDGNEAGFAYYGHAILDRTLSDRVIECSRRSIDRHAGQLESRRRSGLVRQCHGDLHLRNIVSIEGRPALFDAVEFNDRIACVDVLYDLAFLLMDLGHRGLARQANAVWNAYLAASRDLTGLDLMPLFLSCRAAVLAKVNATASRAQRTDAGAAALAKAARTYLGDADRLLHGPPPSLIAIGGLSGSGKSTLADGVAPSIGPVPGAVILRSDEIRKELCGVAPLQRLGPDGYAEELTQRVYAAMRARAATVLAAGHAVIADAVHLRGADRAAIEAVAIEADVPFTGIWLDADLAVLGRRVNRRRHDPSDADATVLRMESARDIGDLRWPRLDAAPPAGAVLASAVQQISQLSSSEKPIGSTTI